MNFDEYHMALAKLAASKSKDTSTQVGAIITRPDRTIAATGYNGFPMKIKDLDHRYLDRETKLELIIHAEMNAILTAREPLHGYTLYTWPLLPCPRCAVHVIQAGIARVVSQPLPADKADRWKAPLERSIALFREAGVELGVVLSGS
jgi:dCMP deaminase